MAAATGVLLLAGALLAGGDDPDKPQAVMKLRDEIQWPPSGAGPAGLTRRPAGQAGAARGTTDAELSALIDRVAERVPGGNPRIILAEANSGFGPMVDNWLAHLHRSLRVSGQSPPQLRVSGPAGSVRRAQPADAAAAGRLLGGAGKPSQQQSPPPPLLPYLIVALDEDEYRRLGGLGANTWYNSTHGDFAREAQGFWDPAYLSLVMHKWTLVLQLLRRGVDVLLSDVDALIFRDPLRYVDTLPACDAYFATESFNLFPADNVWFPEGEPPKGPLAWLGGGGFTATPGKVLNYVNSGFAYLRANERVISVVTSAVAMMADPANAGKFDGDQPVVNAVLQQLYRAHEATSHVVPPTLVPPSCANYGPLSFHVFSPFLFQNGKHARHLKLTDVLHDPPVMRHYNFLAEGPTHKVAMMQHEGTWLVGGGSGARAAAAAAEAEAAASPAASTVDAEGEA